MRVSTHAGRLGPWRGPARVVSVRPIIPLQQDLHLEIPSGLDSIVFYQFNGIFRISGHLGNGDVGSRGNSIGTSEEQP